MTSLTKEMRKAAITKAMAARFKADEAALEAQRTVLADKLYEHFHGKYEAVAKQLPEHWTGSMSSICIECDGFVYYHRETQGAPLAQLKLSKERRSPRYDSEVKVDAKHPLYKQAQAVVKVSNAMHDAKAKLRADLNAILFSCNTVKQLQERWPEGVQFVPVTLSQSTAIVPVSAIKRVNDELGLNKKARAKAAA